MPPDGVLAVTRTDSPLRMNRLGTLQFSGDWGLALEV